MSTDTAIAVKVEAVPGMNDHAVHVDEVRIESTSQKTESSLNVHIALDEESSQKELEVKHGNLVRVKKCTDENR